MCNLSEIEINNEMKKQLQQAYVELCEKDIKIKVKYG
jgi:hypothetical protein